VIVYNSVYNGAKLSRTTTRRRRNCAASMDTNTGATYGRL